MDHSHSGDDADPGVDVATRTRLDDIRGRLDGIAEELADIALDLLRQAVDEGANRRPDAEKVVTRSRQAVEKAARLLDS